MAGRDLRGLVLPVAFVVLAEAVARAVDLRSDTLAPPSAVALALLSSLSDGSTVALTAQTLGSALAGLAIGMAVGIPGGLLLGASRVSDRLASATLEVVRPIPAIALAPVATMVFGLGFRMEIAIVAFATAWPLLLLTRSAVIGVEPKLLEVARVLGFGPSATVQNFILPAALPRILVALRLAVGVALVVAVTVEVTSNPIGLGYGLMSAEQSLDPALMLAILVWIGLVGWLLSLALIWAERLLLGRPTTTPRVDAP